MDIGSTEQGSRCGIECRKHRRTTRSEWRKWTASLFLTLAACTGVPSLQAQTSRQPIEAEVVAFTAHGFQPPKITRKPGQFQLCLNNTTKLPSLTFSLDDGQSQFMPSTAKLGPTVAFGYRQVLTLGVGTYTVRLKELPSYTMTIVISPSGK